jgi:hypothetical protein
LKLLQCGNTRTFKLLVEELELKDIEDETIELELDVLLDVLVVEGVVEVVEGVVEVSDAFGPLVRPGGKTVGVKMHQELSDRQLCKETV